MKSAEGAQHTALGYAGIPGEGGGYVFAQSNSLGMVDEVQYPVVFGGS